MTLELLWMEYKAAHHEGGYQYSQFRELYRTWRKTLDMVPPDAKVQAGKKPRQRKVPRIRKRRGSDKDSSETARVTTGAPGSSAASSGSRRLPVNLQPGF